MPKAITQKEMNEIAAMIREWPQSEPFKWDTICKGVKSILGYVPTRQALSKKPMLANAYKAKKKQQKLEVNRFKNVPRPQSTLDAMQKIARLQEENQLLKSELAKMAEVANRFIYNASLHGLSQAKLMVPLPNIKDDI